MMSNVSSYNKGSEVESYSHLIYVEAKNYYQYIMDGEGFLRNGIRIYSIIVDGLFVQKRTVLSSRRLV